MLAGFLPASVPIPRPAPPNRTSLSSSRAVTGPNPFGVRPLVAEPRPPARSVVRMGGGPRTFPGGVSRWQWKRMQAKKAKQLLKARLCRERQLYEMRKRAELKAAVSALEHPWDVVPRAPKLFSASADDQLKALADRFQRPGGFDMWSDRDGPQVFRAPDALPTARFFPKGAVHSVKPYGILPAGENGPDEQLKFNDWIARGAGGTTPRSRRSSSSARSGGGGRRESSDVESSESINGTAEFAELLHSNSIDSGLPKQSSSESSNASNSMHSGFHESGNASNSRGSRLTMHSGRESSNAYNSRDSRYPKNSFGRESINVSNSRDSRFPKNSFGRESSNTLNSRESRFPKHSFGRESSNTSNSRDSRFTKNSGPELRNASNSRYSRSQKHFGHDASNATNNQRFSRKGLAYGKKGVNGVSRSRGGISDDIVHEIENRFRRNMLDNSAGKEVGSALTDSCRHGSSNQRFRGQNISLQPATDPFSENEPY